MLAISGVLGSEQPDAAKVLDECKKPAMMLHAKLMVTSTCDEEDIACKMVLTEAKDLQRRLQETAKEHAESQLEKATAALLPLSGGRSDGGSWKAGLETEGKWKDIMKAAKVMHENVADGLDTAFRAAGKEHSFTERASYKTPKEPGCPSLWCISDHSGALLLAHNSAVESLGRLRL